MAKKFTIKVEINPVFDRVDPNNIMATRNSSHQDRRTKRNRTRSAQTRKAIKDQLT
jgi:hypothetical protein